MSILFCSDIPSSQKLPSHGYPLEHPFNKVNENLDSVYELYQKDCVKFHYILYFLNLF